MDCSGGADRYLRSRVSASVDAAVTPEISTTGCDPSGVAKFVWWLVAIRVTALLRIRQK